MKTKQTKMIQVPKCDQCQQIRINGIVCHETGCPNQTHECFECETKIPKNQRYCEDCAEEQYKWAEELYNWNCK